MEKGEPLCTVCGDVNWCSHYSYTPFSTVFLLMVLVTCGPLRPKILKMETTKNEPFLWGFLKIFFKRFYLFLERMEGRERGRENSLRRPAELINSGLDWSNKNKRDYIWKAPTMKEGLSLNTQETLKGKYNSPLLATVLLSMVSVTQALKILNGKS